MFKKILVGYAGDRASRDAVVLAAELAALDEGELEVVYPYHPLFADVPCDEVERRVREELHGLLAGSHAFEHARYRWSGSSWPIRALHEMAVYERSQLLVIGSAQVRMHRRHLNLMERMVHGAPCAVAVAPAGYAARKQRELRTIGVGYCDSEEGRAAIVLARELAERTGAAVRLIAGSSLGADLAACAADAPGLSSVEDEMDAELSTSVEAAAGELLRDCTHQLEVRRGDPARLLIGASKSLDLLVLGSRAYGPVRHALLGSVSGTVMRTAHCPLLVVPRGACTEQPRPAKRLQTAEA